MTTRIYEVRHEVTSAQIRQLRAAAEQVGDVARMTLCDRALTGEPKARRECEEIIRKRR